MRSPVALCGVLLLAACSEGGEPRTGRPARSRPLVLTTIHPLQFLVERLAGDRVDCAVVMPAGEHPQHWVPDRPTLQRLAGADLVVLQGASLESWQGKVGLPRSRQSIVCTGWGVDLIKIEGAITHTHGGKAHTHSGTDPFVWLDLRLAARQAEVVAAALQRLLPGDAASIAGRLPALQRELTAEHQAQAAVAVPGARLAALAAVYSYWARSCGVEVVALDLHDQAGRDRARTAVAGLTARVALCASPPSAAERAALQELGLAPVLFDPCFTRPAAPNTGGAGSLPPDFLQAMVQNRQRLVAALAGK